MRRDRLCRFLGQSLLGKSVGGCQGLKAGMKLLGWKKDKEASGAGADERGEG